jgi:hypothetical protein
MHLSCPPYVPHDPRNPFSFSSPPEWYLVSSTDDIVARYLVFSTPLFPHTFRPKFLSTLFRKLSASIPPSLWKTKFHTHTKQQAKLLVKLTKWNNQLQKPVALSPSKQLYRKESVGPQSQSRRCGTRQTWKKAKPDSTVVQQVT